MDDVRLLDLGAGQGGDLFKYINSGISKVYGLEENKPNIREFMNRYENEKELGKLGKFKVEWIIHGTFTELMLSGDAAYDKNGKNQLEELYKIEGPGYFNLVSCQFAMHYAFSSEYNIRAFIHNVFLNLKGNGTGYFFGTVFDGYSIFKKLASSNVIEGKVNDKLIWRVEKKYNENKFLNFGQEIDVLITSISLKPITEYLVNFKYFTQIMKDDYDMEIISNEEAEEMGFEAGTGSFTDFYNKMLEKKNPILLSDDEKNLIFLYRYFIFKKIGTGDAVVIKKWNKLISERNTSLDDKQVVSI